MRQAGVREAAAIGVPDAQSGEAVKLFIVRKEPKLTAADVIAHARKSLTGYKVPRHVEFVGELPKSERRQGAAARAQGARRRSADGEPAQVEREPDEAADERAVDADELQIRADVELDAPRRRLRVPALDGFGNDLAQGVAIVVDDVEQHLLEPVVELRRRARRRLAAARRARRSRAASRAPAASPRPPARLRARCASAARARTRSCARRGARRAPPSARGSWPRVPGRRPSHAAATSRRDLDLARAPGAPGRRRSRRAAPRARRRACRRSPGRRTSAATMGFARGSARESVTRCCSSSLRPNATS